MGDLSVQLGDAARLVARRWWLVLGLAALGVGAAVAYQAAIDSTEGNAEARIGFGIEPEFYDILPNQQRIDSYVESGDFATALAAATEVPDDAEVDIVLPNGIQAFADLRVRNAGTDDAAVQIAGTASRLVIQRMDEYYAIDDGGERLRLEAKLVELADEEAELRADEERFREIQTRTVLVRFEDEGAFGEYEAAAIQRGEVLQRLTSVVNRQGDIDRDLLDLERRSPPREFELLSEAVATSQPASDRPLPVIGGLAGAALGLLLALAADRSILPLRTTEDLAQLNVAGDTLLVQDSVRSVALLVDRRLELGQRVVFVGFAADANETLPRVSSVLELLGTANVLVGPDMASAKTEVGLIDGGSGDSGVAEVAHTAHGAVLLVGRGARRAAQMQPALTELAALGVEVLAVVLVDAARG